MSQGHCYLLTNPYMPGLVKIGRTDRSPYVRAAELSEPSGVPGRYVVERVWSVPDTQAAECRVHAAFTRFRVPGSEHFQIALLGAVERIEAILGSPEPRHIWRTELERITAVALLIEGYWPTIRQFVRRLRALRAAFR
jgi:hypothetical protein